MVEKTVEVFIDRDEFSYSGRADVRKRKKFGLPTHTNLRIVLVKIWLGNGSDTASGQAKIGYKREDILAALAYGAEMAREHVIPIAIDHAA